ncbi:hypothetical protein RHMOL_Rhmol11G0099600 [Rhododendron molle]|uniref:Uncharacterized protein n=1 Tax=Rhododendron molle TaxID=49168 RepID=A0ACC0LRN2_RHOML|nr:hypothetical protein RHMOL_Rhmol11G0099600 [Rhododendron molle]
MWCITAFCTAFILPCRCIVFSVYRFFSCFGYIVSSYELVWGQSELGWHGLGRGMMNKYWKKLALIAGVYIPNLILTFLISLKSLHHDRWMIVLYISEKVLPTCRGRGNKKEKRCGSVSKRTCQLVEAEGLKKGKEGWMVYSAPVRLWRLRRSSLVSTLVESEITTGEGSNNRVAWGLYLELKQEVCAMMRRLHATRDAIWGCDQILAQDLELPLMKYISVQIELYMAVESVWEEEDRTIESTTKDAPMHETTYNPANVMPNSH